MNTRRTLALGISIGLVAGLLLAEPHPRAAAQLPEPIPAVKPHLLSTALFQGLPGQPTGLRVIWANADEPGLMTLGFLVQRCGDGQFWNPATKSWGPAPATIPPGLLTNLTPNAGTGPLASNYWGFFDTSAFPSLFPDGRYLAHVFNGATGKYEGPTAQATLRGGDDGPAPPGGSVTLPKSYTLTPN